MNQKFIDLCKVGEATPEQIEDYSYKWFRSQSKMKLHDFLGFTTEEYFDYVSKTKTLTKIIKKRQSL